MAQENINVVARVRPSSDYIGNDRESCLQIDATNSIITVKSAINESKFNLNGVFDENATQEEIYNYVRPTVNGFLEGINGTIFAYGQTGSGKTYTMLGPDATDPNGNTSDATNYGIIPRAVESIFKALDAQIEKYDDSFTSSVKCSFVELYNEQLYDLLQDDNTATIKIQTSQKQISLVGAAEFEVTTYEECIHHLWRGWNQRKVAETKMNRESSRSHAVFMLTLVTEHIEGSVINRRSSRLNLVDLAGSERQGQTQNTGHHLKEAGSINKSLSILARVIRELSKSKAGNFIPYRDSPLTLLLRDSLGGNAKTTVIVNIHPNSRFIGDTVSTLGFAENVKKVKNSAVVNEAITCKDIESWKAEIRRLRQENGYLKAQLEKSKLSSCKSTSNTSVIEEKSVFQTTMKDMDNLVKEAQLLELEAAKVRNQAFSYLASVMASIKAEEEADDC